MLRTMIRQRWQVTIPAEARRLMGFFIGQVLNWQVLEADGAAEIRIFTGAWADREEIGLFLKEFKMKDRRRQIRKSEVRALGRILQDLGPEICQMLREHVELAEKRRERDRLTSFGGK